MYISYFKDTKKCLWIFHVAPWLHISAYELAILIEEKNNAFILVSALTGVLLRLNNDASLPDRLPFPIALPRVEEEESVSWRDPFHA